MIAAMVLLMMQAPQRPPMTPAQTALADRANKARAENRLDEAVTLYRRLLAQKPTWGEGWFFLGTIQYEREQSRECAAAFGRFTRLHPTVSAGHAFHGLCLFQMGSYGESLAALTKAEQIGLPAGEQLTDVASYHAAILFTREQNFERALQILHFFSRRAELPPKIVEATGIAALRMPILPTELKVEDRELVYRMGRAVMTASARRANEAAAQFDEIVRDFPKTPNVHYAWGTFLLGGDPDKAVTALKRELEVQPDHLPSLVLLALEFLKRGDAKPALEFGRKAAEIAPRNFTAHVALGRALVESGELEAGIVELELAVKLEPTSPQTRIALASAYQRAGNAREAARHRAEFQKLKQALEAREKVQ